MSILRRSCDTVNVNVRSIPTPESDERYRLLLSTVTLIGVKVNSLTESLTALRAKVECMAGAIDRVELELSELTSAGDAMALLLQTLSAEIRAGANSETRMHALADKMDQKEKVWIAAALENTGTPVTPPVEDPPPDEPPATELPPGSQPFGRKR